MRKTVIMFLIRWRPDTIWTVQPQKMATGLTFKIYQVEGLYYLCSENKGTDQLQGYHTADQHLCLRMYEKQVLLMIGLICCGQTKATKYSVLQVEIQIRLDKHQSEKSFCCRHEER